MEHLSSPVAWLALATTALATLAAISCAGPRSAEVTGEFYSVRGTVEALDGVRSRVKIRHEAIPEFVDASGEVIGMDAMAMWFGVGDPSALVEGDEKLFRLRIDWLAESATDRARVVAWSEVELASGDESPEPQRHQSPKTPETRF